MIGQPIDGRMQSIEQAHAGSIRLDLPDDAARGSAAKRQPGLCEVERAVVGAGEAGGKRKAIGDEIPSCSHVERRLSSYQAHRRQSTGHMVAHESSGKGEQ